jgi:uncharacterized membrane protein YhhN
MSQSNYRRDPALQERRRPRRWLWTAGVVVLFLLAGLFVTSLYRTPNPAWTPITAVATAVVAVLLLVGFLRRRR